MGGAVELDAVDLYGLGSNRGPALLLLPPQLNRGSSKTQTIKHRQPHALLRLNLLVLGCDACFGSLTLLALEKK